jgi:hypothetical protein
MEEKADYPADSIKHIAQFIRAMFFYRRKMSLENGIPIHARKQGKGRCL